MSRRWGKVGMVVLAAALAGCQGGGRFARRPPAAEPELLAVDPGAIADDPALGRPATFVDRHPLLRKPVEYYQDHGGHTVGKVAAATFIGIPAGMLGEARQIIVGCPPGF